jgi:leucyl aminopeptidase (aminopeptidase T)
MNQQNEKLARNARITLEVACGVTAGQVVAVCTRRANHRYATAENVVSYVQALAREAVALGAHPVVLDLTEFLAGSAYAAGTILAPVVEALRAADTVINTMDDVGFSRLIGRRDNDDEFLTARGRWVFLQANGMEHWNLDPRAVAAIRPRTEKLIQLIDHARHVRITTAAGTDFTFAMGQGSAATPILGIVPLYGEVATAPRQGSENGRIVVTGPTQMGVRRADELDRPPLVIDVAHGRVTAYDGDREQVARLEAFLAVGDPVPDAIDEVGIPTSRVMDNDRWWWSDGTHHLRRIHVALGNNLRRDTHVHGARHMDTELDDPTLVIDGVTVLKDGDFTGPLAM